MWKDKLSNLHKIGGKIGENDQPNRGKWSTKSIGENRNFYIVSIDTASTPEIKSRKKIKTRKSVSNT